MQNKVIKLTPYPFDNTSKKVVLIGVESIIEVVEETNLRGITYTAISSRAGLVKNNYVKESVEQVWKLINE